MGYKMVGDLWIKKSELDATAGKDNGATDKQEKSAGKRVACETSQLPLEASLETPNLMEMMMDFEKKFKEIQDNQASAAFTSRVPSDIIEENRKLKEQLKMLQEQQCPSTISSSSKVSDSTPSSNEE